MRDHKNTKKMNFGINRNVMTLIGLLLLALASRKAPTYRNTSFASLELQSSAKSHTITSFPANCWT